MSVSHEPHTPQALAQRYPSVRSHYFVKMKLEVRLIIADERGLYKYSDHTAWTYGIFTECFRVGMTKTEASDLLYLWCQNGSVRRELHYLMSTAYRRVQRNLRASHKLKKETNMSVATPLGPVTDGAVDFCTKLMLSIEDPSRPFTLGYTEIAHRVGMTRPAAIHYTKLLLEAGYLVRIEAGRGVKKRGNSASTYQFAKGV